MPKHGPAGDPHARGSLSKSRKKKGNLAKAKPKPKQKRKAKGNFAKAKPKAKRKRTPAKSRKTQNLAPRKPVKKKKPVIRTQRKQVLHG